MISIIYLCCHAKDEADLCRGEEKKAEEVENRDGRGILKQKESVLQDIT